MRTKLAHVCIESNDLQATEAFYRVLGLERRFEFRNLQGELVGFYLAFYRGDQDEQAGNRWNHQAFRH
jgi:catechol 2,3-dioxygenase-like lactoylglutathione lyase family enzyme